MLAFSPEDIITDADYVLENISRSVAACSHRRYAATGADTRARIFTWDENPGR